MITYDLSGKTALVTGSNRGIGKAMADALEASGAKVIRTSSKECDLNDRDAVYAFVEKIKKEHQVDILVNNAGAILRKPAATHPDDFRNFETEKIRSRFVMEKVMEPDKINVTYTMYDRLVYGGAMPVKGELTLDTFEELKAEHFLERRELGVINVGGTGVVTVDGAEYELCFKEALYVGCGKKVVSFKSVDPKNPAKFYLNSAPAYKEYVTEGQAICHQMGQPQEQRLVWLHNEQAITSPEWSVHSAAGTSNYMFIWGMAGENLNYGDMDKVPVEKVR